MNIKQVRYASDNMGYLIYGGETAAAVDGGAVDDMMTFLRSQELTLKYVLNTHSHFDHTSGNQDILKKSGAALLDNGTLRHEGAFEIDGEKIHVVHTPGHTNDGLTFHAGNVLLTGDTLFTGTVGNCFSGDLKGFFESTKRIMEFPRETVIYPGHDYVRESLIYGKSVEPENEFIDWFLNQYNPDHVFSTLADELKMNLFLRFNEENVISMLKKNKYPADTEFERWTSLMNEY